MHVDDHRAQADHLPVDFGLDENLVVNGRLLLVSVIVSATARSGAQCWDGVNAPARRRQRRRSPGTDGLAGGHRLPGRGYSLSD